MAISNCGSYLLDDTAQEKKSHGSFGFPVAIYRDILEDEEVIWHWHIEMELILVHSGQGIVSCNGKSIILDAGHGIFINSGNLHSCKVSSAGHCEIHSIVFHPRLVAGGTDTILWSKYVHPIVDNKNLDQHRFDSSVDWEHSIINLIDKTWNIIKSENEGYEFEVREGLSKILLLLFKNVSLDNLVKENPAIIKISRLRAMTEYIQANYTCDIKIPDIAAAAMVSESECQRCFKNILGTTPIRLLLQMRLQKSCELLTGTDLPASRVSEMCGFSDNSYFGKLFKREMGMTPFEYRNKSKNP